MSPSELSPAMRDAAALRAEGEKAHAVARASDPGGPVEAVTQWGFMDTLDAAWVRGTRVVKRIVYIGPTEDVDA